jgi:hypothetical protein
MAKYGKAAMLILVPVLAMAQAPQVRPAPQQRPAPPAAPAASGAAAKPPATRPVPPADSKRFVTNENFFHASPKPQPNSSAPANTQPGVDNSGRPAVAGKPSSVPVISRPVMAPVVRPAAATAPVPEIRMPQPALVQPVVITGSTASAPGAHESAAVDYSSGQLTVVADNAPLSFVLKLVAAKTGAVVDLAPELQNEPVVARLGPTSVREVLTGLLDSPRIDYIVFGTGDEPGSLQRIVVRTRHSFGQVAMAAIRQPQPRQQDPDEDVKLDANGHLLPNAANTGETPAAQQQRMEEWQKVREQMRQAEIKQQAEDREREKTQSPDPPAPQNSPENPPQPQQDNPPQR